MKGLYLVVLRFTEQWFTQLDYTESKYLHSVLEMVAWLVKSMNMKHSLEINNDIFGALSIKN